MVFSKAAYNIWLEPLLSTIDMALKSVCEVSYLWASISKCFLCCHIQNDLAEAGRKNDKDTQQRKRWLERRRLELFTLAKKKLKADENLRLPR